MKIKKQGNFFVAYKEEIDNQLPNMNPKIENGDSLGKINIKTGKFVGNTVCMLQLNEHLETMRTKHHKGNKVAKLVEFSLLVRVVVDENATDDEIIEKCYSKVQDKINNRELGDNMVSCEADEEMPFGEGLND
jgi:hypothetical protein